MFPTQVQTTAPRRLIALPHSGAYLEIGRTFEQLVTMLLSRGLWDQTQGMIGVYHDDPGSVPQADLRSHAGALVTADMAVPEGMEEVLIPGGRAAVMRHTGPYSGLKAAYDYLYGQWLPASGEDPADGPCYEVYLNSPSDTAPEDLQTDVYMPLRAAET